MRRPRRGIGYTIAVSSGQELVTAAPSYLDYALGLPETKVLALVLEAIREPTLLRRVLARAAERDIPVILLTAGRSASGRMMVAAHSGALAAGDGGWEALARAYGVHRVSDLAELADSLELFAIGRRAPRPAGWPGPTRPAGIATVHDSGLERAHAADLAEEIGVPFAPIAEATRSRLAEILDPGQGPAATRGQDPEPAAPDPDAVAGSGTGRSRRDRGLALLGTGVTSGAPLLELLGEYGIAVAAARHASDAAGALAAAQSIGYPVVLKTAAQAVMHKSDARGVFLDIRRPAELAAAYTDLSFRLGPEVLVCASVPPGTELALGIARDPDLGPLIVVGTVGRLVQTLADRAVALPPVDEETARQMIAKLRIARLLAGARGAPPADLGAAARSVTGLSELALDLS